MTGPHRRLRTISIACSGAPKTAGGRVRGERDCGSATAIGPRTMGRGITASALQTPLDNRSTSQAGWARDWRETAGSGRVSGAMVHLLKHMLCWEHDGVTAITGPPPTRPDDRPTLRAVGIFDVCSNAAVNSDLSCFLYRGRMKRPYLHCRADSVA